MSYPIYRQQYDHMIFGCVFQLGTPVHLKLPIERQVELMHGDWGYRLFRQTRNDIYSWVKLKEHSNIVMEVVNFDREVCLQMGDVSQVYSTLTWMVPRRKKKLDRLGVKVMNIRYSLDRVILRPKPAWHCPGMLGPVRPTGAKVMPALNFNEVRLHDLSTIYLSIIHGPFLRTC